MKVAYTSDIHADITLNNKLLVPYLVEQVKKINPDVFVMAGDISNSLMDLDSTLEQFRPLSCCKVMIPGNHDIWIESNNSLRKGKDSFYKYRQAIPETCQKYGFIYPVFEPYIVGNIAIVGGIGWYDYSLQDCRLSRVNSLSQYERGQFSEGIWNDTKYAVWLKYPQSTNWRERQTKYNNRELFGLLFDELKDVVQQVPENVDQVLFVLHTAPFQECIPPKDEPCPFDAYEGSVQIGEYIHEISKQKNVHVICGHRHKKLDLQVGKVQLHRSPVGYLDKSQTDYEQIAKGAVDIFEI